MKLIHLSDLHIGKRVNEVSMIEEQEYILAQILNIVDAEQPGAVLISGDVYDKSVPSAEAVTRVIPLFRWIKSVFIPASSRDFSRCSPVKDATKPRAVVSAPSSFKT